MSELLPIDILLEVRQQITSGNSKHSSWESDLSAVFKYTLSVANRGSRTPVKVNIES